MIRTKISALFVMSLLLSSCAPTVASDAAPGAGDATDAATDAVVFETSAESAVPPLPSLDAGADAG